MVTHIPPYSVTPSRRNPTTFSADMDTRLSEENARIEAANTQADEVNALAEAAEAAAATASAAADEAAASAADAVAAANVSKWVSGTTYAEGACVWSPVDYQTYRRKTAGGGTTDPSEDAINWEPVAISPSALNTHASATTGVHGAGSDSLATTGANTFTGQQSFKEVKDTVYTITDGAAFEIDPGNGSIQVVTLGADRTPAATNFEAGQAVLLGVDDGSGYTITWTTINPTWVKYGGGASAPTLATTGYTWILLWKVGSTIYGGEVGKP